MIYIQRNILFTAAIKQIKRMAETGIYEGTPKTRDYLMNCNWFLESHGAYMIFTRDVGMHSSGMFKNPDYERCYHLSLSFKESITGEPLPKDKKKTDKIVSALFEKHSNLLWCEPPYSKDGIENYVWHYRLFCDEHWQPIKPRAWY